MVSDLGSVGIQSKSLLRLIDFKSFTITRLQIHQRLKSSEILIKAHQHLPLILIWVTVSKTC